MTARGVAGGSGRPETGLAPAALRRPSLRFRGPTYIGEKCPNSRPSTSVLGWGPLNRQVPAGTKEASPRSFCRPWRDLVCLRLGLSTEVLAYRLPPFGLRREARRGQCGKIPVIQISLLPTHSGARESKWRWHSSCRRGVDTKPAKPAVTRARAATEAPLQPWVIPRLPSDRNNSTRPRDRRSGAVHRARR